MNEILVFLQSLFFGFIGGAAASLTYIYLYIKKDKQ